jgi:hypothetical protein
VAVLRAARPVDIDATMTLQAAAQRRADVAMPHSAPCWRWLLTHDATTTWVLDRAGAVVATGRTPTPDGGVLLAEAAASDEAAALDLLRCVARLAEGDPVRVVHRPGTITDAAWGHLLTGGRDLAEQYYLRIPDPAALLARLAPVLWHRLTDAGLDRAGRSIVISTFGAHYRIDVGPDGLGEVTQGGPLQAPGSVGGAGVAPDRLPALLFGPHGMAGLSQIHPDVYPGPDRELFTCLFPPLSADLLTYYLPY